VEHPLKVISMTEMNDEVLRGVPQHRHYRIVNQEMIAKVIPDHRRHDRRSGTTDHGNQSQKQSIFCCLDLGQAGDDDELNDWEFDLRRTTMTPLSELKMRA
jgi:hypothetical protein